MDKDESRIGLGEPLAVRLTQGRAGNDDGVAGIESLEGQSAHPVEPWRTVGVRECLASPHLLNVRRRVYVICLHEPRANRVRQLLSNGRLSCPRGSDDHDRAWKVSHARGSYSQRSAVIGSTVVARRTGTYDATIATAIIAIAAARASSWLMPSLASAPTRRRS